MTIDQNLSGHDGGLGLGAGVEKPLFDEQDVETGAGHGQILLEWLITKSEKRRDLWILGAIVAVAALVRFYRLGDSMPIDDEYYQFCEALHPRHLAEFLRLISSNPHHLLVDLLASFVFGRFGGSPAWLRLPAALLGTASIPLFWLLARETGRPRLAAPATFLLAISLFHADWSRRVDFYALLVFLTLLLTRFFFKLSEGRWKMYAAVWTVFLYAHPYAFLQPALHAARLRLSGRRALLKACAAGVVVFLPWLGYSAIGLLNLSKFRAGMEFIGSTPLVEFLARAPLSLGQAPEAGPGRVWSLSTAGAASALYLAAYVASLVRLLRRGGTDVLLKLAHWMVGAGLACVVVIDLAYGYFIAPRQLLWLLPFYLYAVVDGAEFSGGWGMVLAAGLAAPVFWGTAKYQFEMRERLDGVISAVRAQARPGDALEFASENLLAHFFILSARSAT